ncbi:MAG: TIGR03960 family B12-binding radical SAM protein, partial [Oscillospiraceae bacterium]|nr:TIGR03960 family B12-binding radical SAM protein [Oscillospiraceae bacterium]
MEEQLKKYDVPLFTLESMDPVRDFDMVGFTLQYEMSYTNMLNMLSLSKIPLRASERESLTPMIVAGGPCVCNSEPVADFVDLCMLGEGEEVTNDLIDLLKEHKKKGSAKAEFLREAAKIDGIYVPSLYDVEYNDDGTVKSITAKDGAPSVVKKRIVSDLDSAYFPASTIVPSIEVVHDRTTTEIFRGCIRGCRFCQAGFLYRPIRDKSPEVIDRQCRAISDSSGYDEISLCSLSASDYSRMRELIERLISWTDDEKINVALPSLRADNFPKELMEKLAGVRRSSLTFAPEAGTQRLRDAINKNVTEEEVLHTARQSFEGGWNAVKLYFMIGLPTETEEDVKGIAHLAQKVVDEFYKNPDKPKGKSVTVSVSTASFVPKPFTPFQWEPQNSKAMIEEKQELLRNEITTRKVSLSCHNSELSRLEAVFARGDRRLGKVLETAFKKGCRFDGWDDMFRYDLWQEAFDECSVSMDFYANRAREYDEVLPWDHIDYGVSKSFLIRESEKARNSEASPNCREKCMGCTADKLNGGVCDARCKTVD